MASLDAFDISFRTFGSKIIPSIKNVECTEHLALRSHTIQPYTLNFFVAEKRKEFVDVVNIKIEQHVFPELQSGETSNIFPKPVPFLHRSIK